MRDTFSGVESDFRELMLKMTGSERLLMGCSMYDMSKSIVKASILDREPNIKAQDLKLQTFLRFYKRDYEEKERDRIIKHLKKIYAQSANSGQYTRS